MNEANPQITVLITAHNEAERIQACLHAVSEQDYPMERVEILLVDDRSTDSTVERAEQSGLGNLRILRLEEPQAGLTTRQAALDLGIREAKGEIVMIADAGGRVPREWMRELAGHMGYRDGAVTAPVIFGGRPRFLARFQSLDALLTYNLYHWAYLRDLAAGVFAANMAVRREAYLEIGGFEKIGFAPAQDLALGAALRKGGWSLRYLTEPSVLNLCAPTLRELIARKRRRLRNTATVVNMVFIAMILSNLGLLIGAVIGHGVWVVLLLIRYLVGLMLISMGVSKYGPDRVQDLWLYEIMLVPLGSVVYLSLLVAPGWRWGGTQYRRSGLAVSSPRGETA